MAKKTAFKRDILENEAGSETASLLQTNLVTLIDLALLLKQAHWNVIGQNFRSVYLPLADVTETVRMASDEVAERINTLGIAPDGRSLTVIPDSNLEAYTSDFQKVADILGKVADALKATIDALRSAILKLGDLDPVSKDMCIAISAGLEKHLSMVQAQQA